MTEIHPVSLERHKTRSWNKVTSYGWARHDQVKPVALEEALTLMMTLPLAFFLYEGEYQLIVLLGLRPNENLWVGIDNSWLAPYVPAVMLNYPFILLRDSEGRNALGVDEIGLLPLGALEGNPLFDEADKPVAELVALFEQLVKGDQERRHTRKVAGVLAEYELLEPWNLQVQNDSGTINIEGLYRVDEKKLNEISAEALVSLRNSGALLMAYSQLLSMKHTHQLGRLAEAHAKAQQGRAQTLEATQTPGGEHGIISFANL